MAESRDERAAALPALIGEPTGGYTPWVAVFDLWDTADMRARLTIIFHGILAALLAVLVARLIGRLSGSGASVGVLLDLPSAILLILFGTPAALVLWLVAGRRRWAIGPGFAAVGFGLTCYSLQSASDWVSDDPAMANAHMAVALLSLFYGFALWASVNLVTTMVDLIRPNARVNRQR